MLQRPPRTIPNQAAGVYNGVEIPVYKWTNGLVLPNKGADFGRLLSH